MKLNLTHVLLAALLAVSLPAFRSNGEEAPGSRETASIITAMHQSARYWNEGNLDAFMSLYDTAATFMMLSGPVGISGMRENYQKGFFNGTMPKQQLSYDDLVIRPLGKNYALLTGRFLLTGNNLKDRTGRYTLVFKYTRKGWKILHDHS
jgi:ketosteroid isomerase-like protein